MQPECKTKLASMKYLLIIAGFIAVCYGHTLPLVPDNSHYVEGESRYIWMPDGEGNPVLVDLEEPVDEEILNDPARNGANNRYFLFTSANPNNADEIVHNNVNSIRNSRYRNNRPVNVIVHGWNQDRNAPMNAAIRQAFLAVQDCNVIVVDWGRLANSNYITAANGVPGVGQHLGNFLNWLLQNGGGNWNQVHLVGFSLGAHVVGNAGRQTGGRPARVTGLDPAGYRWHNNGNRLAHNNGQYVEAIHTDGGILGIMNPSGNADFYPNGGKNPQPGCRGGVSCSHGRAPDLFASSVRHPNRFVGRQCNSVRDAERGNCNGGSLVMGNANHGKRGNGLYWLRTGAGWPF